MGGGGSRHVLWVVDQEVSMCGSKAEDRVVETEA